MRKWPATEPWTSVLTAPDPGTAGGGPDSAPHPCPRPLRPGASPPVDAATPHPRPRAGPADAGPRAPACAPSRSDHSPGHTPSAGPGSGVPRAAARRPGSGHSLARTPSDAGAATSASAAAARHVTPPGPPPAPWPAPPPAPRRAQAGPPLGASRRRVLRAEEETQAAGGDGPDPHVTCKVQRKLADSLAFTERLLHTRVLQACSRLPIVSRSWRFVALI